MAEIVVKNVSVVYGSQGRATRALDEIDLQVADGEFLSILGPSGCGKTTLLNLIAGLLRPTAGAIEIGDRTVTKPGPDRAVVFQEAALLPWRTVLGNVELGQEMQGKLGKREIRERAQHYIELVGLHSFEHHYPHQLSGGMRQRVNLARALIADPGVLLMDEPFASLDAHTREAMGFELLRIWQEARKTVVFITHSVDEALILSDRTVVMSRSPGRILEQFVIDLPRPRTLETRTSPAFNALGLRMRALLAQAMDRPAAAVAGQGA